MAGTGGAAQLWNIGSACPRPRVTSSAPQTEVGCGREEQREHKQTENTRKMEDQAEHLSMKMRISIFPDSKDIET